MCIFYVCTYLLFKNKIQSTVIVANLVVFLLYHLHFTEFLTFPLKILPEWKIISDPELSPEIGFGTDRHLLFYVRPYKKIKYNSMYCDSSFVTRSWKRIPSLTITISQQTICTIYETRVWFKKTRLGILIP